MKKLLTILAFAAAMLHSGCGPSSLPPDAGAGSRALGPATGFNGPLAPQGGTITSVQPTTGGGLTGGGTSGAVTLGLLTSCGANQILQWSGSAWACSASAGVTGTGTSNSTTKFTGTSTIGNAWPTDDGTTWGVAGKFTITEASGNTTAFGTLESGGAFTADSTIGMSSGNVATLGKVIVLGANTNTAPTNDAAIDFFTGRASGGGLVNANQTVADLAFDYGGASGGYRHWISTEHDTTAVNNKMRFWLNNSATSGASSLPGTGNVEVLRLNGNQTVAMFGALDMASSKITSIANGTASSDAAAFGQIGTAVNAAVTGTTNTIAMFTGTNTIGNSSITDNGTTVATSEAVTISNHLTVASNVANNVDAVTVTQTPSATTLNFFGAEITAQGTADATSANVQSFGAILSSTTTRSAGTNQVQNFGLRANASGGQYSEGVQANATGTGTNLALEANATGGTSNTAFQTDGGNVVLNNTSGTTTIGGATTINNNLTATGTTWTDFTASADAIALIGGKNPASTTSADTGFRFDVNPVSTGNIYWDNKLGGTGVLVGLIGAGTTAGNTNQWLQVTGAGGVTLSNSSASVTVQAPTTINASTSVVAAPGLYVQDAASPTASVRFVSAGGTNFIESGTSSSTSAAPLTIASMNGSVLYANWDASGNFTAYHSTTLNATNGTTTIGGATTINNTLAVLAATGVSAITARSGTASGISPFATDVVGQLDSQSGHADYLDFTSAGIKGMVFSNASNTADGYVVYDQTARAISLAAGGTVRQTIGITNTTIGDNNAYTTTINGNTTINAPATGGLTVQGSASGYTFANIVSNGGAGNGFASYLALTNTNGSVAELRLADTGSGTSYQTEQNMLTLSTQSGYGIKLNVNGLDNNGIRIASGTGVTTMLAQGNAVGGLYQSTAQDIGDSMASTTMDPNLSPFSDVLGDNSLATCVATGGKWHICNYTDTITYSTVYQVTPRGANELVGQVTASGTVGSDYRLYLYKANTGYDDVRQKSFTFSVWLKVSTGTQTVGVQIARNNYANDALTTDCSVGTSWTRCAVTDTFSNTSVTDNSEIDVSVVGFSSAFTTYMWGATISPNSLVPLPYTTTADGTLDKYSTGGVAVAVLNSASIHLYAIQHGSPGNNYTITTNNDAGASCGGPTHCFTDGTRSSYHYTTGTTTLGQFCTDINTSLFISGGAGLCNASSGTILSTLISPATTNFSGAIDAERTWAMRGAHGNTPQNPWVLFSPAYSNYYSSNNVLNALQGSIPLVVGQTGWGTCASATTGPPTQGAPALGIYDFSGADAPTTVTACAGTSVFSMQVYGLASFSGQLFATNAGVGSSLVATNTSTGNAAEFTNSSTGNALQTDSGPVVFNNNGGGVTIANGGGVVTPLNIAGSTQLVERIRLSGQEWDAAGHTDTNGPALLLAVNRTSDRRIFLVDSANEAQSSTNTALSLAITGNTANIDAESTDFSTTKTLNLQGITAGLTEAHGAFTVDSTTTLTGAVAVNNTLTVASTATTPVNISSTSQLVERIRFSGQEFFAASNTDTSGPAVLLGLNRTGDRRIWIVDSAAETQSASNPALQIAAGSSGIGTGISAISTDGTTQLQLSLSAGGGPTVIGSNYAILGDGHHYAVSTAPAASSCGTGPSLTGTDDAFKVTTGTGGTTCTITFHNSWTNPPVCSVLPEATTTLPTCTISAAAVTCTVTAATTKYNFVCFGVSGST